MRPLKQGDPLKSLGRAVRQRRQELGISQEELGYRAGLHRTYIGDIERGSRNLTFLNFLRLARALEIEPPELFATCWRMAQSGLGEGFEKN